MITQSSTVLMVDMSRSMLYNGCFSAAKKVALALDSLIRTQFPRDNLYILGFSYVATGLKPVATAVDHRGTNTTTAPTCSTASCMARQLLARHKGGNKQVIVITDGEPTAHFDETDQVRFAYPPTWQTLQETLKEVMRCTREQSHDQHVHARTQPLHGRLRLGDGQDQQGPRLLRHPRPSRRVHPGRLRRQQAQDGEGVELSACQFSAISRNMRGRECRVLSSWSTEE